MYAYLEGKLTYKSPTTVYLDVNGQGFLVHISLHTFSKIEPMTEGRLFTYLHVKEDGLTLYGFFDEEEKNIFVQLISVSGIGPNTARIILSSMTPLEVRTAVVTENDDAFRKVKGVGPKTAKRVILDLKDKLSKEGLGSGMQVGTGPGAHVEEAIEALAALGFQRSKVKKVLDDMSILPGQPLEVIIKQALQKLT